ncbi:MAG TPA: alpha/beta fold hydrolase [Nitrososphaerales archaeon]|nr:alpha/beta fold hydrolase [Nitrososphaerales archaeon]
MEEVATLLEEKGHEVHPITLTGMGERVHLASKDFGIETAIEDVLNVIKYNDHDDFVLVGHSFAGKVAAAVADRAADKVRTLLFLDAFWPHKGIRTPQGALQPDEFGPPKPGQWTISLTEEILESIGKDVKGQDREWLMSNATPWPLKLANEPISSLRNLIR